MSALSFRLPHLPIAGRLRSAMLLSANPTIMRVVRAQRLDWKSLLAIGVVAIMIVSAVGCGGSSEGSATRPYDQLRQLAPLEPGKPVLLFVYTDG